MAKKASEITTLENKIAKLENKKARYSAKIEKWENFDRGVQNWDKAMDKVYDRITVKPPPIPIRTLSINIDRKATPNYQTRTDSIAAGLNDSKVSVNANWQKMSIGEYKDFYKDRHGLLNKIDAHFNYSNEGKIKGTARQVVLSVESNLITGTKSSLRQFKEGVVSPTADFAMRKFREKMQTSDQSSSQRAGIAMIDNSARAVKWTANYARASSKLERRTPHNALNNFRNETLKGLYEKKITKFNRKNALTEAKLKFSQNRLSGTGEAASKFSHKQKKAAWKTITGSDKFEFRRTRGNTAENMDRSMREKLTRKKMLAAQRKRYQTRLVKTYDYNELTGKTKVRFRQAVDTSKPKEFKAKRPDGMLKSLSKAGAAAVQSRAFNQMAQSDNYGVEAAGRVSRTTFSQVSRLNAKRKASQEKKFRKTQHKAKMQYEKANAKLQVQSSKMDAKRAQKRMLRKKRNTKTFQEKLKAKRAAKQSLSKKSFLGNAKSKKIALTAAAAVLLLIVPLVIFMGGGSSSLGTVIPVEDDLIAFADSYFDNKVAAVVREKERSIRNNNDDVNSVTTVIPSNLEGITVGTIPAYLSAKFGGEWTKEQAMAEIDKLVAACYSTKVEKKYVKSVSVDNGSTSDTSSDKPTTKSLYDYTITLKYTTKVKKYVKNALSKDERSDYNDLMDSRGGHQTLSPFTMDKKYFVSSDSRDYYTFPTSSLPEHFTYVSGEFDVIASGNGTVTGITDGKLVIIYEEDNFSVTYKSSDISVMSFSVGDKVKKGDNLFSTSDGLYLSTYNEEVKCYINPYYIFNTVAEEKAEEESNADNDDDDDDEEDDDE